MPTSVLSLRGALLLLVLLLAARGAAVLGTPPHDTTFVSARVARHAAEGLGPLYNPGRHLPQPSRPVESPLGLALLAGLAAVGLPPLAASRGLAVGAELAAVALLLALLRRRPVLAAAVVVLLAATPELGAVVGGGGTPPLALALVVAAAAAAARGWSVGTGVLAGLASAAATEAALVLPGIWLTWRRTPARLLVETLVLGAVAGASAWLLVRWTGDWRPTPLTRGLEGWGPAAPGPGAVVLGALALLGRGRGVPAALRPLLVVGALAAVPWLVVGESLAPRAAYLPLAVLVLPAAAAAERAVLRLERPRLAAVAALALVAGGTLALPRRGPRLEERVFGPLARWGEEADLEGLRARLLASEVGLAGWYLGGVVQPAAHDPVTLAAQLRLLDPEYLLLRTARPELAALRSTGDLSRGWYPVERFSVAGETALEPNLEALPEEARDDYLLFCRRL